jgi:hypothetical protein
MTATKTPPIAGLCDHPQEFSACFGLTVDSDQGFHIEQLDTGYMQRHNPFAFMYEGVARPAN